MRGPLEAMYYCFEKKSKISTHYLFPCFLCQQHVCELDKIQRKDRLVYWLDLLYELDEIQKDRLVFFHMSSSFIGFFESFEKHQNLWICHSSFGCTSSISSTIFNSLLTWIRRVWVGTCLIVWVGSSSFHSHGGQGLCEYYLFYPTHHIK